jgi:DNA-directed RNA polymerase specialized sigma24 family protein
MKNQPAVEKQQASIDIEHLLTNVVHRQIADYMDKFSATIERKLGLTKDDLLNDMREQIWKGLLTHKKDGAANLKTYLNTLIKNRFLVLYDRSTLRKYNSVDYYADAFSASTANKEFLETEETGETLFARRQECMRDIGTLSKKDQKILGDLYLGFNIGELMKRNNMLRTEVTAAIKRIDSIIMKQKLNME